MNPISLTEGGLTVSPIIAGTWKWGLWGHQLSIAQQAALIQECVDLGVTTFDLADIYGDHSTEDEFGRALAQLGSIRSNIQLVTKCGIKLPSEKHAYRLKSYDTSREHILWSVDNALRSFGTDYLDLLLIHRPSPLMDPDEIADAFYTLHRAGKVLHFGVSNFTPSQFQMLNDRTDLATNQVEASLLQLSTFLDGTLDQAIELKKRPMIWSPFGSGKLFTALKSERVGRIAQTAKDLLDKYGVKRLDQIYLAWLLRHPSRPVPLLGTARIERIRSAIASLQVEMSREDWFRLWTAAIGTDVP